VKWNRPLRKSTVIVIAEISMLFGFVLALFMVPGSTPSGTFLIICGGVFLLFNALFFWGFKRKSRATQPRAAENHLCVLDIGCPLRPGAIALSAA
jgi:hypothetical protein